MLSNLIVSSAAGLAAAGKAVQDMTGSLLFFSVMLVAIGLLSIFYPRFFWYLRIGRKVKGVEPGNLYLWVLRIGGMIVFGLGAMIYYYFIFI